jgi:lipid A 3-O-deacylase
VSGRPRLPEWVGGLLAAMVLVAAATTARAEPALRKWTKDVGVAAGGSISLSVPTSQNESITGFQLVPHVGLVLTEETGEGWLRGNFELLAEPTLIHLEGDRSSATVGGISALARWIFVGTGRVRPYLEAGGGVLAGQTEFKATGCDVNFALEGGPGVMVLLSDATALTIGYRFQHISNGGRCSEDLGLNSSVFLLGLSYIFP